MTDTAPISDKAWAFAAPVRGCGLADPPATARNAARLRSGKGVSAVIHMIRLSDAAPDVSDLPRRFVWGD